MKPKGRIAVANFLLEQEWYDAWYDNLILQEEDFDLVRHFVEGHEGASTIENSIVWYLTPEGDEYWREINKRFKEWFYGE